MLISLVGCHRGKYSEGQVTVEGSGSRQVSDVLTARGRSGENHMKKHSPSYCNKSDTRQGQVMNTD